MPSRRIAPILLALTSTACAPSLSAPLGDGGSESSTTSAESSASDEGSSGSTGSATTSSQSSDGSSTSSSGGDEVMPCPPSWPDDGSEVVELVSHDSVAEWFHNDVNPDYHSFLSDTSPIPGTQTRGLAAFRDNAVVAPYQYGATVGGMPAEPFQGKRIRMRSLVALEGVEGSASLWMRLDEEMGETSLALDNPHNHPGWGTSTDWELHEVVMDVPTQTTWIAFGSLLVGPGTIVVSDPSFEIVTDAVPTTSPNRRPPPEAITCSEPTDAFVEEVLHYTHPHVWYDLGNEQPVAGLQLLRDEQIRYDDVPTLHVELDGSARLGDSSVIHWPPGDAYRRVRLTLPIRADFDGEIGLFLEVSDGETVVWRATPPIEIDRTDEFSSFTVVGEVPDGVRIDISAGIVAEGTGDLWVGYGVIEHVTDDVPLTPIAE
jgi:hypothetical protein